MEETIIYNSDRENWILYEVCPQYEYIMFIKEEKDADILFEGKVNNEKEVEVDISISENEEYPITNHYMEFKSI